MFNGFPSTQTPTVQWWDYSKSYTGTIKISLPNDCAPVQYFATGGSTTAIELTLPPNPAQGKTITIKNDLYGSNSSPNGQVININYGIYTQAGAILTVLGVGATVTLCYIGQNTLANVNNYTFPWVSIAGATSIQNNNFSTAFGLASRALGQNSTIGGGNSNYALGTLSTVGGGTGNTASGNYSNVSGGQSSNASGISSMVAGGDTATASGDYSIVVGGSYGTTRLIAGNAVTPASVRPFGFTAGLSQCGLLAVAVQTTDATATVLRSNTSAASSTNQVIMPNNSAYYFRGECIAGVTGAGDTKGWYIEGVIKRGAGVGTTVLVGTPSVTSLYADAGATTWSIAVTADTTNGGLAITVTGQAATTIRWVCQIRTTEMTY
jgi:hypothetical protein